MIGLKYRTFLNELLINYLSIIVSCLISKRQSFIHKSVLLKNKQPSDLCLFIKLGKNMALIIRRGLYKKIPLPVLSVRPNNPFINGVLKSNACFPQPNSNIFPKRIKLQQKTKHTVKRTGERKTLHSLLFFFIAKTYPIKAGIIIIDTGFISMASPWNIPAISTLFIFPEIL